MRWLIVLALLMQDPKAGDKATITVDGKPLVVQVSMNLAVVGSKDLP